MKSNRRSNIRKERIIMLASSAFVLAALTMTGLYMRGSQVKEKDDGYTLDFTALEDSADDKFNEIVQNLSEEDKTNVALNNTQDVPQMNLEDDLDYMPLEAGSGQVEIPGLTDGKAALNASDSLNASGALGQVNEKEETPVRKEPDAIGVGEAAPDVVGNEQQMTTEEMEAPQPVLARELHFSEADTLFRPVAGNVLIPYSMDKSVYFATLDQYKYNPAMVFEVAEGTDVSACAAGKVVSVFKDAEIGNAIIIELGDGYRVTYGQLTDIRVSEENYVEAGDKLGTVAAPTKYYSEEGANLYFRVDKDGEPIDPGVLF